MKKDKYVEELKSYCDKTNCEGCKFSHYDNHVGFLECTILNEINKKRNHNNRILFPSSWSDLYLSNIQDNDAFLSDIRRAIILYRINNGKK